MEEFCKVCGKPKFKRIKLPFVMKGEEYTLVSIACDCELKAMEEEERLKREEEERLKKIAKEN